MELVKEYTNEKCLFSEVSFLPQTLSPFFSLDKQQLLLVFVYFFRDVWHIYKQIHVFFFYPPLYTNGSILLLAHCSELSAHKEFLYSFVLFVLFCFVSKLYGNPLFDVL